MTPVSSATTSSPFRAVLFDLDGTLIDHFETLFLCYQHTLTQLGRPVPSRDLLRRSVGGSMEVTMRKFVEDAQLAEAASLWRARLAEIYLDDVTLMPGAGELVRDLHTRGWKLGVLTNKLGDTSRGIMRHLGLEPFLHFVLGAADTPHRKPQREFSDHALTRMGARAEETVLVGDSPYDIDAGRIVGMRCACVSTGTHTAEELRAAGADAVYPSLTQLGAAEFGQAVPQAHGS